MYRSPTPYAVLRWTRLFTNFMVQRSLHWSNHDRRISETYAARGINPEYRVTRKKPIQSASSQHFCDRSYLKVIANLNFVGLLLARYVPEVAKRNWHRRPTDVSFEKFQMTISPEPVTRPNSCSVLGEVFGDGGSNGAISGSTKSKVAADGHLGKF